MLFVDLLTLEFICLAYLYRRIIEFTKGEVLSKESLLDLEVDIVS